ncbi:hypothetical protein ANO11243_049260 [Dothideomycetidae sp. 11243]|nr:hypothetical protein ANO11243_049260 [fungal sp. No.11243]
MKSILFLSFASLILANPTESPGLCPAVDGQTISNANSAFYTVKCASDSWQGAYGSVDVASSYLGCLNLCDSHATTDGCGGFVYVGGVNGTGAGRCWLKTSLGVMKSAPLNYIAATRVAKTTSAASTLSTVAKSTTTTTTPITTTTTTTSSTTPHPTTTTLHTTSSPTSTSTTTTSHSPTPTPFLSCPSSNGETYTTPSGASFIIECSTDHFGGDFSRVATSDLASCINTCATTPSCVDVSLSAGWCYLKNSLGFASVNTNVWGARLVQK